MRKLLGNMELTSHNGRIHNLLEFKKAVVIETDGSEVSIRQAPFICVFCGYLAGITIKDKYVCLPCCKELKERVGG